MGCARIEDTIGQIFERSLTHHHHGWHLLVADLSNDLEITNELVACREPIGRS